MVREYQNFLIQTNSADVAKVLLKTYTEDDVVASIKIHVDAKTNKLNFEEEGQLE